MIFDPRWTALSHEQSRLRGRALQAALRAGRGLVQSQAEPVQVALEAYILIAVSRCGIERAHDSLKDPLKKGLDDAREHLIEQLTENGMSVEGARNLVSQVRSQAERAWDQAMNEPSVQRS
jgi:hypothetical protein